MIKKIIYISYEPLTEKIIEDFYIQEAQNNGYEIEYLDLSKLFFSNVLLPKIDAQYIVAVSKLKDLEKYLLSQDNKQTLYVLLIAYEYRVVPLFSILTKYNCQTVYFSRSALPYINNSESTIFSRLRRLINLKSFITSVQNKYAYLLKKYGLIKYYDIIFAAGKSGIQSIGFGYQIEKAKSKIVNMNSIDFDRFFFKMSDFKLVDGKYCLFLDEYLPYHPDFELLNIKTVDPKIYYRVLNEFFDIIETKYKIEVVIAAHPKAEKYKLENFFNGRRVIFNKTAELSRYAEFSISHCSTSVSFSVLNMKPIFFLYSNDILEVMPHYFKFISYLSETLGGTLLNIDNILIDDICIMDIDESKYNDYKYNYLSSEESERRKSSDIIFQTISEL